MPGYQTGANNQLLSDGTYTYVYDAEGNRTRRTHIASGDYEVFTWDHRNRLTGVAFYTAGGVLTQSVTYAYDVFDRRIARSHDANGDGAVDVAERYVYDGEDVLLDFSDADGAGPAGVLLARRYFHGPGIDHVLAQEDIVWSEGTGGGSSGQSSYQSSFEDEFAFWQAVNAVMAGFGEAEARAARDNKLAQIASELLLLPPDEQARAMNGALAELGGVEDGADFFAPTLDDSGGQGGPADRGEGGPVGSAGNITAQTTSGGGASAQSATSTVLWLLPDNLGTTRDVIDNSGAAVNHVTYAAFGAITAIVDAAGQPFTQSVTRCLYTQREFDFATHLNYHRARYYDPTSGRWLSEDRIGFTAADTNLARYVSNGATNGSDPTGLQGPSRWLEGGGGGGGGAWASWPPIRSGGAGGRVASPSEGHTVPARIRQWDRPGVSTKGADLANSWGFGDLEWLYLRRGCVGLCAIRTGSCQNMKDPMFARGVRCFTDLKEALDYQKQRNEEIKKDKQPFKKAVLFAIESKNKISDFCEFLDEDQSEVKPSSLTLDKLEPYDFATAFQKADGTIVYWERMPYGISKNPDLTVKRTSGHVYEYRVYCVVVTDTKFQPHTVADERPR
jgi:RHS repeat-associated protein